MKRIIVTGGLGFIGSNLIDFNEWTLLTFTYDGGGDPSSLKIYKNGKWEETDPFENIEERKVKKWNVEELKKAVGTPESPIAIPGICGIKIFMGSSTGDLLVNESNANRQESKRFCRA